MDVLTGLCSSVIAVSSSHAMAMWQGGIIISIINAAIYATALTLMYYAITPRPTLKVGSFPKDHPLPWKYGFGFMWDAEGRLIGAFNTGQVTKWIVHTVNEAHGFDTPPDELEPPSEI